MNKLTGGMTACPGPPRFETVLSSKVGNLEALAEKAAEVARATRDIVEQTVGVVPTNSIAEQVAQTSCFYERMHTAFSRISDSLDEINELIHSL